MELFHKKKLSPAQKEWEAVCKKDAKFSERKINKKEAAWNQIAEQKVPPKLQETLDAAFEKAFSLIFEKGVGIIEKTFSKEKIQNDFKVQMYADEIYGNRKTLKAFTKKAEQSGNLNLAISGVSGVGMGLVGMGLPDIPVFTAMMMRCVYETALHYGFDYETEREKYFILLLIEGAVSVGKPFRETDRLLENFIQNEALPEDYLREKQIAKTSKRLSKELLYMKFLQGIPIVGAVGGAYDAIYIRQMKEYANIKYKKRFLLNYKNCT